jgi:hypothetical protein
VINPGRFADGATVIAKMPLAYQPVQEAGDGAAAEPSEPCSGDPEN